jgi:predicted DNA-binding protein (MmcQ/YjbR family)
MAAKPIVRLRKICLALPESAEVEAWGEPTFRVKNKIFAMHAAAENHHGAGRPAVWLKAQDGLQAMMVRADAERFFVPPYVGKKGWLGIRLDGAVDWDEIERFVRDSYKLIAPTRLVKQLDGEKS